MVNKCNHKPKALNSSIKLLNDFKTFVFPKRIYGICEFCGKNFTYILDEKGEMKKFKEDK